MVSLLTPDSSLFILVPAQERGNENKTVYRQPITDHRLPDLPAPCPLPPESLIFAQRRGVAEKTVHRPPSTVHCQPITDTVFA
jgi:hypothetical protein